MNLDTAKDIGDCLKELRTNQRIDQSDLASYISASDRTVRNIEKGATGTKTETVFNAAKELGMKMRLSQKNNNQNVKVHSLQNIGQLARKLRKEQGIRQDDLADIIGIQHSILGKIEKGDETVAIGKVLNVLEELGLRLSTRD